MFRHKKIPPDSKAPQHLMELALEMSLLARVNVPKLVSKTFPEDCEPPIWNQIPGEVWVYEPELKDYTEQEIRWLITHAICSNEHDPPKSLAAMEVEGSLVLIPWLLVPFLAITANLWITAIWLVFSIGGTIAYFCRVGIMRKAKVLKALELARTIFNDPVSEATILEKQYKRWDVEMKRD